MIIHRHFLNNLKVEWNDFSASVNFLRVYWNQQQQSCGLRHHMESGHSFPGPSSYWMSAKWNNGTHHRIYLQTNYLWWEHVIHPGVKPAGGAWLWSACRHPIILKNKHFNYLLNNIIIRNPYWESETLNGVNDIVERGLPSINPSYPKY